MSAIAECSAIAFSAREAMTRAPNVPVTATISVPGDATARASASSFSVTRADVLALTMRMRMGLALSRRRPGVCSCGDSAAAVTMGSKPPNDTAAPAARKVRRSDSGNVTMILLRSTILPRPQSY
jgi:hypothetical protein